MKLLDIPARYMWGWGPGLSGFCGSASVQTVALYFGNWLTQNEVRGFTGGYDATHQLVLGGSPCCSAVDAARHFHLRVEEWKYWEQPQPQALRFVEWMKDAVDRSQPVVFGVYMTVENNTEFDHIVPLVGYDDESLFFNDLYFNRTLRADVDTFVQRREACSGAPEHAGVKSYCLPQVVDLGFSVIGNVDPRGELFPVRLIMSSNAEPDYSIEDGKHDAPSELSAEVVVTGLPPGGHFALLRFSDVGSLPGDGHFLSHFLASGRAPEAHFEAPPNGEWRQRVSFPSNSTQFYRCVELPSDRHNALYRQAAPATTLLYA